MAPCTAALLLSACSNFVVMDPKGPIGAEQKNLIIIATALMLIVVIPVIIMAITFALKYRASNNAEYRPDFYHSNKVELFCWGIPIIIILILGTITWKTSHSLDPYKPLESDVKPLEIQVVALDWKWMFIYPEQGIATVNEIAFPVGTPLNFRITSDSVMNAFFIPQLGSMIYAMAGMETKLHLQADHAGTYDGISANYSGAGFADMKFKAIATTPEAFQAWVNQAKTNPQALDGTSYATLATPSNNVPVSYYGSVKEGMFTDVLRKYMHHDAPAGAEHNTAGGHVDTKPLEAPVPGSVPSQDQSGHGMEHAPQSKDGK